MRKLILLIAVPMLVSVNVSCAKPDYKKVTDGFIAATSRIKDYTIREVADTSSSKWKAVIVYVKQGRANVPLLFFVSADGKSIVPNSMVYENNKAVFSRTLETELGRIDFKLTEKNRFVYNPSGKKTVYVFFDPDCPYCKKAKEKLLNYSGEYRVVVKYFPLEQIHPGATQKAIREQAELLKKNNTHIAGDSVILEEAKRMVEEDIMEARKAEISGVPTYVLEDGTLKEGLF